LKDRASKNETKKIWEKIMLDGIKDIIRLGILQILIILFYSTPNVQAEVKTHRVHFPSDRSMGTLYVLDWDRLETSSYSDWELLCEATGDVTVPAGKALRLNLNKDAGDDLSPLSALEPNDLQMLFCYGVEIVDDELRHLSRLTGLRELYLRDTGILGTGLKYLSGLHALRKIRVDNTHVGDNELAYLSNLPSLESLNLWLTPTGDVGMVHVGKITTLKSLVLSRGVSDEGLSHLRGLTSLQYLLTGGQGIDDEGVAHLADMTQMEILDLRDTLITDDGLVHLKKMKKLKRLILYGTRVTEKGFAHLENFKNLEELEVLYGVTETGLMHLSKLPSLKNITIDGDSITSKGIETLSKMKSLEHLYIDNTDKMDIIVKEVINLPGIKELTLGTGLTDEGLVKLKDMRTLQELTIGPSRITGKGISALAELPSLQALTLHQIKLTSEKEWTSFGKLTSLKHLTLRAIRSEVTDAHIAQLAGLQFLKDLSIDAIVIKDRNAVYSMDVTDVGLGYISKLKSLERLSLLGAKITDEGLQQLSEIPGLKWMDLQGCNVTEKGLQKLKNKLPALSWYL
jgi:Leucine-rich repeat (LRR) protein